MIFSSSRLSSSIFRCKYYLWHCNCYNIWLNLPCLFQSLNQRSRAIFCTLNPNCFGKLVLLSWKESKIYGWHLEIGKMVRMQHTKVEKYTLKERYFALHFLPKVRIFSTVFVIMRNFIYLCLQLLAEFPPDLLYCTLEFLEFWLFW